MAGRKIEVQIVGDTKDLEKSFNKAGNSAEGFGKKLGGMAKGGAIGAAIGATALLGKGLFDSVKAAQEAEKAEVRFQGAMDAVSATAKQRAAAQEAINKVSKQAALDDEDLSDVYAKLARTTGSVTKAQEGMALAADIARARNISLEAAAKTVERAMNGNVTSLKKVGVEIEKGTTATEALEKAQKQFAGSAERYGNSAAGSQEKLGVAFENLQEKVGQKLLPVIQKLSLKLIELIAWAEKNWPKFAKAIEPVVDALGEVWKVTQTMWKVIQPILEVALPIAFKIIAQGVENFATAVEVMWKISSKIWSLVLGALDKVLAGIQAMAEAASHLPFVGDKFKGVAEKIGDAREKVRALQTSIDNLRGKDITITTTLETVYKERRETLPGNPIGRRAAGGPVSAGMPYIVGERGRELFVPSQSGRIVPNHAMREQPIVMQVVLDGKVIAETVRRENKVYATNNLGFQAV